MLKVNAGQIIISHTYNIIDITHIPDGDTVPNTESNHTILIP